MTKDEINFIRLLLIKLYINDYKIFDFNKELLNNFMDYLNTLVDKENLLLDGLFEKDAFDNYSKFINMIFYITEYPKYSSYNKEENRLKIQFDDDYINEKLMNETNIHNKIIDNIVSQILYNHELWPHKRYVKYIKH